MSFSKSYTTRTLTIRRFMRIVSAFLLFEAGSKTLGSQLRLFIADSVSFGTTDLHPFVLEMPH